MPDITSGHEQANAIVTNFQTLLRSGVPADQLPVLEKDSALAQQMLKGNEAIYLRYVEEKLSVHQVKRDAIIEYTPPILLGMAPPGQKELAIEIHKKQFRALSNLPLSDRQNIMAAQKKEQSLFEEFKGSTRKTMPPGTTERDYQGAIALLEDAATLEAALRAEGKDWPIPSKAPRQEKHPEEKPKKPIRKGGAVNGEQDIAATAVDFGALVKAAESLTLDSKLPLYSLPKGGKGRVV